MKNVYGDFIFVCRIVLECLDIMSVYKVFYKNHSAISATRSMLRISYCVYTPPKDTMLEEIVQGICNILVRYIFLITRHCFLLQKCINIYNAKLITFIFYIYLTYIKYHYFIIYIVYNYIYTLYLLKHQ